MVIVGAGLAGLAAARTLQQRGIASTLIDSSDRVGGRVRTDIIDGFRIDRGFQVLLTAYPEAQRFFRYDRLDLKRFTPGAVVHLHPGHHHETHTVANPLRRPIDALRSLAAPFIKPTDAVALTRLLAPVLVADAEDLWSPKPERAIDLLHRLNVSNAAIDQIFTPFFGGVFFDRELHTSANMLRFVLKMFATGHTAVPALGMGELAADMLDTLNAGDPAPEVRLHTPVTAVAPNRVALASGETIDAEAVILATDMTAAHALLPDEFKPRVPDRGWRSTVTIAYDAPEPPFTEPVLHLNGDAASDTKSPGPINHLACMSNVSRHYAPAGRALVYANTIARTETDERTLLDACVAQLADWFGSAVESWQHITTVRIPHALPRAEPADLDPPIRTHVLAPRLFLAGDHRTNNSIDGALKSGRLAADELAESFASAR